jgi:hypothetical protein
MNQEVLNIFNPVQALPTFDQIRISLSSPEKIRSWSFGEIKKPETVCSARGSSDRRRTTSACAASTSA